MNCHSRNLEGENEDTIKIGKRDAKTNIYVLSKLNQSFATASTEHARHSYSKFSSDSEVNCQ